MNDSYVYNGTNVLINLANIKDKKIADDYETTFSTLAIINLLKNPIKIVSTTDIFKIHKILFKEIYIWAGKPRTINIYKNEPVLGGLSVNYSDYQSIDNDLKTIQRIIDLFNWNNCSKQELIHEIVVVTSKIWQVHPFREGNTRTICMFLYFFIKKFNLKINFEFIKEHTNFFRNAFVLASIGEYSEYKHLESILINATNNQK